MRQQLAGFIDHGDLAAGAQAGIDAQHRDGPGGGRQQQVVKIVAEDLDSLGVRAALQLQANLPLDGRIQKPLPGVVDGQFKLVRPVALQAQNMALDDGDGPLRFDFDEEVENVLAFAAPNGQHAMRGNRLYRLRVLVVHLELFLLVDRVGDLAAYYDAFIEHKSAERLAQIGVFADPLGNNVPRAFESLVYRGHAQLRIDKAGCEYLQRLGGILLRPEIRGQRLQALFAGDGGLGAALGLVRKVQVFELALVQSGFDARLELVGELALFGDGGQDGFAPVHNVAEVGEVLLDGENLHFIQVAGGLLAIACDKRHSSTVVEQFDDGDQPVHGQVQRLSDVKKNFGGEVFCVLHE